MYQRRFAAGVSIAVILMCGAGMANPVVGGDLYQMPNEHLDIRITDEWDRVHVAFAGEYEFTYLNPDIWQIDFPLPWDWMGWPMAVLMDGQESGYSLSMFPYQFGGDANTPEIPEMTYIHLTGPFEEAGGLMRIEYEHELFDEDMEYVYYYPFVFDTEPEDANTQVVVDIEIPEYFEVNYLRLNFDEQPYSMVDGCIHFEVNSSTLYPETAMILSLGPNVLHVRTNGDDANADGSEAKPFRTVQAAIDAASAGDVVMVWPGTYQEDIDFKGKNIVVRGSEPRNSAAVEATAVGSDDVEKNAVQFRGDEDPNCMLMGLRISGCIRGFDTSVYPDGSIHARASVSRCVLRNNGTPGGTVLKWCDGTIEKCLIVDNFTNCYCIYPVIDGCNALIRNCTIAGNNTWIRVSDGGHTTLENCIVYDNSAGTQIVVGEGGVLDISYCDLQGGIAGIHLEDVSSIVNAGLGNIDADPCFARAGYFDDGGTPDDIFDDFWVDGDFHLKSEGWRWDGGRELWTWDEVTSRCIDAGCVATVRGDEPVALDVDPFNEYGINVRINIGAYGRTGEASMGPWEWALRYDVNNDGAVDAGDLAAMASEWLESGGVTCDFGRDGQVGGEDFALLAVEWLEETRWH